MPAGNRATYQVDFQDSVPDPHMRTAGVRVPARLHDTPRQRSDAHRNGRLQDDPYCRRNSVSDVCDLWKVHETMVMKRQRGRGQEQKPRSLRVFAYQVGLGNVTYLTTYGTYDSAA